MTLMTHGEFQTASEEWLASSAAGVLSSGKSLALACQAEVQPALAAKLNEFDTVGASLLEGAHGDVLSDDFLDRMLESLDQVDADTQPQIVETATNAAPNMHDDAWMPQTLKTHLANANIKVKWRKTGPGVQRAPLFTTETGERVYLLRAQPGQIMPMHSHAGDEWTLILQGGYKAGEDHFVAGDLHAEDDECQHQPVIDQGETCICLVVDDGPLKFRNPLLKFMQPLFRI
ncbi:MAG: ChrR family anti-sigma-E factor [Henriciella sp.]